MTRKKRNIFIISAISIVIVVGIVFLSLGLTIWRPKSTEEWLNDFSTALIMKQDQSDQKTEKRIVIVEDGIEVARYYQLVEIHTQDGRPVAHLVAEEKFPSLGTTEFNTYDEYYFYDGTMYMSRDNGGEISSAKFNSTWEVFWQVVNENIGKNTYDLSKEVFVNYEISHDEGIHSLSAVVADDKKDKFFGGIDGIGEMTGVSIKIEINDTLEFVHSSFSYLFKGTQNVNIEIKSCEPTEINIKDINTTSNVN